MPARDDELTRKLPSASRQASLWQSRTGTAIILGFAIAALLVSVVSWDHMRRRQKALDDAHREVAAFSTAFAEHMDVTVASVEQVLRSTLRNFPLQSLVAPQEQPRLGTWFRAKMTEVPSIVGIAVTDEHGISHTGSVAGRPPADRTDQDYFQYHRDHPGQTLHISNLAHSQTFKRQGIVLSLRLNWPDGRFAGVLAALIEPSYFTSFYQGVSISEGAVASIFARDGTLLARHPHQPGLIGHNFNDSGIFSSLDRIPSGTIITTAPTDGAMRVFGFHALKRYPLVMFVGLAQDSILDSVASFTWIELALVAIILAGAATMIQLLYSLDRQARTETALRQSESRFRTIAEAIPIAVVIVHAETGRMLFVNPTAADLFGRPAAAMLGQPVEMLGIGGEDWRRMIGGSACEPVEITCIDREQRRFWAIAAVVATHFQNEDARLIALNDISARHLLEEELRRSNAELEQFSYAISHDLQEPLRMVSSYCTLLARRYQGRLDDQADEFIHFAVDGAKRMERMIHDLLDYSRLHRKAVETAPVDLRDIIEAALANLDMALHECGGVIAVGPMPHVKGDASQLLRLFQNLLGNALKYRRPDAAPNIGITAAAEAGGWVITVRDNGIGIEPSQLPRLFQLFQRLAPALYPGTGIGLAMCRLIVERHGGHIWAASDGPNQGLRISFTLPDAQAEARTAADSAAA